MILGRNDRSASIEELGATAGPNIEHGLGIFRDTAFEKEAGFSLDRLIQADPNAGDRRRIGQNLLTLRYGGSCRQEGRLNLGGRCSCQVVNGEDFHIRGSRFERQRDLPVFGGRAGAGIRQAGNDQGGGRAPGRQSGEGGARLIACPPSIPTTTSDLELAAIRSLQSNLRWTARRIFTRRASRLRDAIHLEHQDGMLGICRSLEHLHGDPIPLDLDWLSQYS